MAPGAVYEYSCGGQCVQSESVVPDQPMVGAAAPPEAQPQSQPQSGGHGAFLQQWQQCIQPRLMKLLAALGGREVAKSLALAQVMTYLPVLTEGKQLLKAEPLCLLGAPALQDFHVACCHQGLPLTHLGPMGKVWESGVVQVVQHSGNLPADMHPLNLLNPAVASSSIDEVVYLPVYDAAPGTPVQGVVAVLELMVKLHCSDAMVVANLISNVDDIMGDLALALSNPAQQKQLEGKNIARKSAPADVGMRQGSSYEANNQAWVHGGSARSFGSGGGLARTPSMRVLPGGDPKHRF